VNLFVRVTLGTVAGGGVTTTVTVITDAVNAVNGNSGPIVDDPEFSLDTVDLSFNNLVGWNSGDNRFLDLNSTLYLTAAGDGGPLTGGAEIAVNAAKGWTIFE
jgi:hypothetical protein